MDLLTHAALGSAAAAALAPRHSLRVAALTGALAGLLPDVDALIDSASDPLLNLEYHRHFTHALVMVPVGALLVAALIWLLLRRQAPFVRLYAYAFIGYLFAPLLDACTSYGTHLFWPFSKQPIALSIIPIVDPIFTLAIGVPVIAAIGRRSAGFARLSVALGGFVLAIGAVQHERAQEQALTLAQSRAHAAERVLVKPTIANLLLWRSLYVADGRIYVDAIRVGLPGNSRVYPGESAARFEIERDLRLPADSTLVNDLRRFVAITDGLPVRHPARPEFIGDARYAMLPTSIAPLWGVVIDAAAPDQHVRFETDRRLTPEVRQRFLDMLLGR